MFYATVNLMEEFQCQIDLRQVESATKTVSEIILSMISTSLAFFNYMDYMGGGGGCFRSAHSPYWANLKSKAGMGEIEKISLKHHLTPKKSCITSFTTEKFMKCREFSQVII
jgi:hypothetical protein